MSVYHPPNSLIEFKKTILCSADETNDDDFSCVNNLLSTENLLSKLEPQNLSDVSDFTVH